MSKYARRPAATRKRRTYPRQPRRHAAPARHYRRRARRNPPLFGVDLFKDAALGLAGFVAVKYAGQLAKKVAPSGFMSTPAGQTVIQAAVAIGVGAMGAKMMPGSKSPLTAGGFVAAGHGLLKSIGVPGLGGLGADEELSAKDVAEVQALAAEIKRGMSGPSEGEYIEM